MNKKLLLILGCDDLEPDALITLHALTGMYDIEIDIKKLDSKWAYYTLAFPKVKYDFVYIVAHGNLNVFGDPNKYRIDWNELGQAICLGDFLNKDSILFFHCCHAGEQQVAYKIFCNCPIIDKIIGSTGEVTSRKAIFAFYSLLELSMAEGFDINNALEMVSNPGLNFKCFSKEDFLLENSLNNYCAACA